MLTAAQVAGFQRDGFLIVPGLLNAVETDHLRTAARADERMLRHAMRVADTAGRATNLPLWNHPGNDVYGMIARSHKLVDAAEQLLGGEVYHYHSKLSAKQPHVGGAWEWHQDYGYWYQNGCLFPDMLSVMISIDASTRENGCLQVLRGSQHLGRLEHGRFGEQTGADPQRVQAAMERMELVYFESQPGDGLFFHANLLHASAANTSPGPPWALLVCYNKATNDPIIAHHHPNYTPLVKVPDAAITAIGPKPSEPTQEFLRQESDTTTG